MPKFLTINLIKKMKKVLSLIAIATMFAFVACGPSAEENAAKEKATQDSIAAADSMAKAMEAEAAAAAATTVDSTAVDSTAKAAEMK